MTDEEHNYHTPYYNTTATNIDVTHVLESSLALAIGGAALKAMDKLLRGAAPRRFK